MTQFIYHVRTPPKYHTRLYTYTHVFIGKAVYTTNSYGRTAFACRHCIKVPPKRLAAGAAVVH